MANPEHVKILKEGVEAWNKWREENPGIVPDFYRADLSGANLNDANLNDANLNDADLGEADLSGADLGRAELISANLSGANLGRAEFISANLSGAQLGGASLTRADLSGANLSRADLSGASLRQTRFTEANLSEAQLFLADLDSASLYGADLSGADLFSTNFRFANIKEANFTDSVMINTIFADVDLSQAKGLETVKHKGPSTIGTDALVRSRGRIPDIFLRGAGLSDDLIAAARAMGGAIQFYSCFISYSSKDQLFAERLYADLQAKGVRCWFAPHDVQGGKKLHEQIDDAIRVHERLLLILSPSSIHSEWVKTEIAKARKRETREKRRMLFPVLLKISYEELKEWECFDADTGKDSAREIREYYIPDFSQWERPEKFKEEFEKLVRDLKKNEAAK